MQEYDGSDGFNGTIFGGYSETGAVHDNEIIIGENVNTKLIGIDSGSSTSGDVYNNTVTVNSKNITMGHLSGGQSESGKIYNNTVNVYGGTINFVSGADSGNGSVQQGEWYENVVNIYDGTIGGISSHSLGTSHDEIVNIYGGNISGNIWGGNYNNTINISGGTFNHTGPDGIFAGIGGAGSGGGSGNLYGNTVNITGGTFTMTDSAIVGGWDNPDSENITDAYNNTVNISNATINGKTDIMGGHAFNAYNNVVNIKSGTFSLTDDGVIIGGDSYLEGASSHDNTVNIEGGTFSLGSIIGGSNPDSGAEVYNNVVNISGGTFLSGSIAAGGNINSHDNTMNIYGSPDLSGVDLQGNLHSNAGPNNVLNIYTKDLTAQNIFNFNSINFYLDENISNGDTILTLINDEENNTDISNTDIKAVMQGGSPLTTGDTVTLLTNANGVTEAKSAVGTLADGISKNYDLSVYRNDAGDSLIFAIGDESEPEPPEPIITNDSNNVVNVYATDSGTIYGGYTDTGDASNNTVNLYGGTNLENIYGGYAPNGSTTGNILNVRSKNLTANNIYNFDKLNFYIPQNAINGDTMLTLTDAAGTNLTNTQINAGVVTGNTNLKIGDTIQLITNPNGLTTNYSTTYGKLTDGVSLNYEMSIGHVGNGIFANITKSPNSLNPETEIISKSPDAAIERTVVTSLDTPTIEQKNDIFENNGSNETSEINNVKENVNVPIIEPKGWEIFANMGGGSLRIKGSDGSHVDMTTQSINLGFERSLERSSGRFTIAPIIDYVNGKYDSYLEAGIHGSGNTRYIAGGLIARRMLDNGFYYEGSVRVGKVKTDFASDNIDKTGVFGRVTYDTSATTLAGHLKIGKAFRLNKNNFLDVYGIYYHAHQGSMNADLSSGEHYKFSSANAGRLRIGYRLTTKTSNVSKIYTGLAYQYEKSTGVTAHYKDYSTSGSGDSGSSGMLEIGWIVRPLKVLPWAVDINTTGWIGHQRGITAMAKIQKSF